MRQEFKPPTKWTERFKEMADFHGEAFIKAYRTSKWQMEVELLEAELCVIAVFTINARTNKIVQKI